MPFMPGQLPPTGRKWTVREDNIVRLYYPKGGTPVCIEKIHAKREHRDRTPEAIRHRAHRLGVRYHPTGRPGRNEPIPLADAHRNFRTTQPGSRGQANDAIVAAATADGVLVRGLVYPYVRMAPAWWVDQYVDRFIELGDEDRRIISTWLTTDEVAQLFGIKRNSLMVVKSPTNPKPYAIGEHLRRIPTRHIRSPQRSGGKKGLYWEPDAAQREARLWAVRRQRNRVERYRRRRATCATASRASSPASAD